MEGWNSFPKIKFYPEADDVITLPKLLLDYMTDYFDNTPHLTELIEIYFHIFKNDSQYRLSLKGTSSTDYIEYFYYITEEECFSMLQYLYNKNKILYDNQNNKIIF